MVVEEYITHETAKLAKEKGFDSPTLHFFDKKGERDYGGHENWNEGYGETCSCPTQALLQKWLREKHKLHIYIETTSRFSKIDGSKWKCDIKVMFQPFKWTTGHYYIGDTYEEVLEKGLQVALRLIE